jgi:Fic/DOC family
MLLIDRSRLPACLMNKRSSRVSRTRYLDLDDRTEDARHLMRERPREARDFMDKYELSWVYHENALEGMVLTHAELRQAFDPTGITDSSMVHTYTEIRNQKAAIEFVKHEAKSKQTRYTQTLVKKLYEILYQNLPNRMPVALRRDMPLHRTYFHDIVQPVQIQPGLEQLFDFMNSEEFHKLHPIRQATHSHHRFMEIFPFSDLSGKVARLHARDRPRHGSAEVLRRPAPARDAVRARHHGRHGQLARQRVPVLHPRLERDVAQARGERIASAGGDTMFLWCPPSAHRPG